MIEHLKAAADQLHAAWDNYSSVYSSLQQYQTKRSALHTYGFPPELTHLLDTELTFMSSLPSKIAPIEVAVRRARNYSSGLAPINALPPEVLTRIFYLALDRPCHHIDFPHDNERYEYLFDKAELYIDRSGWLPIEIHILEESFHDEMKWDYEHLEVLLDDISDRVATLEMVATGKFGPFHRTVFGGLFRAGTSNPKKLVLSSKGQHCNTFIFPTSIPRRELGEELNNFGLNMSESDFARGFSTINTLHTRGIFPYWSSTAYHGLVDLRLLSTHHWSHIKKAEIRLILESSPGLRILYFGLAIQNPAPKDGDAPVDLHDLELVKLFSRHKTLEQQSSSSILPLLASGQKHLRVSVEGDYSYSTTDDLPTELESFLLRCKVVDIHIQRLVLPVSLLLRHSAHLGCVVLSNFDPQLWHEFRASLMEMDGLASSGSLHSLRLRNSHLSKHDLRALLAYCPSGIILDKSSVYHDETAGSKSKSLSKEELSTNFPEVKIAPDSMADPTADWDILD
ncbi:F-box-like domain protein, putative [Rhizoctonia solani AG-3 Rhs1AP]|uniref:F-box-like domain protein, putative n=1 Tax=Rhizoctonia solani AG-3 Rhs1AP TaxID=1086054 RepID=X8JUX0_9AGAM|nr:F-box-like domain protein, putative [Rhizoctonia solani AG-3 Rhs1AP]